MKSFNNDITGELSLVTFDRVTSLNGKDFYKASGFISGDSKGRFEDGEYIHTSVVTSHDKESGIIITLNSKYKVTSYLQDELDKQFNKD